MKGSMGSAEPSAAGGGTGGRSAPGAGGLRLRWTVRPLPAQVSPVLPSAAAFLALPSNGGVRFGVFFFFKSWFSSPRRAVLSK